MSAVIYAVLSSVLMVVLALNVVKQRRLNQVLFGDGDVTALLIARSAHANAAEYIPVTLILLMALEYNGSPLWLVHGIGCVFMVGRLVHARGMLAEVLPLRAFGMYLTLFSILGLAIANMVYLPYDVF